MCGAQDGLEKLGELAALNLSDNPISTLDDATQSLSELQFLVDLDLTGNPVQEVDDYRLGLIHRLQRLLLLDRKPISPEEKVAAVDLFDPALDVIAAIDHVMHISKQLLIKPELNASTTGAPELLCVIRRAILCRRSVATLITHAGGYGAVLGLY